MILANDSAPRRCSHMFLVNDADVEAIRIAFQTDGEFAAVVEFRRRFPGITDPDQAHACVRNIAGMRPLSRSSATVTTLRPGKCR